MLGKKIRGAVKRSLRNLFDELFLFESRNLFRWRQNHALEQTGLFVEEQLPNVHAFETRYDLMLHVLDTQQIDRREGLICEFGVASGKSVNFLANKLPGKAIFGFDSFEGLPETWRSSHQKGTFAQEQLPSVRENVTLVPGLFEDSLGMFLAEHPENALLLHIDCDLYSSTKAILDLLRPRIIPGTVLVFDEFFNYPGWLEGEYKAFFEFIKAQKLQFEYLGYNGLGTQLAVTITQ